ncbi:MAG: methyltransferase domain-containing protein [Candidatus Altiarchaeota archaeon]
MTAYGRDVKWNMEYSAGGVRLRQLEFSGEPLGGRVLDAKCFQGFVIGNINAVERYGIESSDEMITHAKRDYPGVNFSVQTPGRTDFQKNFFDSVICMDLIEVLVGDVSLIREMNRILKPGGRLFISTTIRGVDILPFRKQLTKDLQGLWKYRRTYSEEEFTGMLESNGFHVTGKRGYMRLLSRLILYMYVRYTAYSAYKRKTLWKSDRRLLRFERLLMKAAGIERIIPVGRAFKTLFIAVKR